MNSSKKEMARRESCARLWDGQHCPRGPQWGHLPSLQNSGCQQKKEAHADDFNFGCQTKTPISDLGLATASSVTTSEFCEKFRAKCKCKSQPKYPKMQNLNFTKSLLRNQNIKKIFKKSEINPKCEKNVSVAMAIMVHVTMKYRVRA